MVRQACILGMLFFGPFCGAEEIPFDRPSLGVRMVDLPELVNDADFKWPTPKGVLVVDDAIPAEDGEEPALTEYDVIYHIGTTRIDNTKTAINVIRQLPIGEEVAVRYYDFEMFRGKPRWRKRATKVKAMTYGDSLQKRYRASKDEISGAVSHHPVGEDITRGDKTEMSAHVVELNGVYVPVISVEFRSSDWLFVKNVTFVIEGEEPISLDVDMNRDNSGRAIWEWGNIACVPSPDTERLRSAIRDGKVKSVFYRGDQYRHELDDEDWSPSAIFDAFELCRLKAAEK